VCALPFALTSPFPVPIIYAVVARPDCVLAEFSAGVGNFSSVAQRILAKIVVGSAQRQAYAYDRHVFNYVVDNGLVFLCMTDESFEKRLAFAFLDDVKRRWSVAFANRGATAARFAMNDEFSRVLQKQMDFYASGDPAADKLGAINKNVEEVKGIMVGDVHARSCAPAN
jgi:vesicle-associated membrane protein 7